jgi:isoleucyl-tRNA synthetase
MKSLEAARKSGSIGKALEAKIRLELPEELFVPASKYQRCLKELLNVSQVEVGVSHKGGTIAETLPADGIKCERCWNYSLHVGEDPRWPVVCDRCAIALDAIGFPPMEPEVGAA